ncbi:hypothetical protein [Nocardia sp. NPDC057440]|uniref:hypothetical protein n=1 Tax=Nocardia sp. NPDC057440 TaxID=3346134 RepID=UPI00366F1D4F
MSNPGGPGFVLDRSSAAALHNVYRCSPAAFLHHSGRTHRNRLSRPDFGIEIEFLGVAAVKEYPRGYLLPRVYEGGYTVNFYKPAPQPPAAGAPAPAPAPDASTSACTPTTPSAATPTATTSGSATFPAAPADQ